ncbi:GAF domain-containing protein (plasmid) [Streptomyces sp. NBC_00080]|uniref:GAF domain-containing protein n=1 Tax=Streptomyces sp. NBC_00080 TaxID=2975645 RepID=UPI002F910A22
MTLTPPHQTTPEPASPAPVPSLHTVQRRIQVFTDDPATELTEMATRLSRFNELGIRLEGSEVLDDIAVDMGERAGFLYAMVNAFGEEQTFLGLRNPPRDAGYPLVGRTMSRAHGYCPEVVHRRRGLPLPNVAASPRFQGNHVVDAIGIQSYFGSPLIDETTGLVLATVCIVDPEPRTLADAARLQAIVKDGARAAAAKLKMPAL